MGALEMVEAEASEHLTAIAAMFQGSPRVTLLVRHPDLETIGKDADLVLTNDDLAEVARMVARRRGRAHGWQPITTVPRDRWVLLGCAVMPHAVWRGIWWQSRQRWALLVTSAGDPIFDGAFEPTHWCDLPDPPGFSD